MERHFDYAVDGRFLPLLLPFGFRRSRDGVTLNDDGGFSANLGLLHLRTELDNVEGAHVTDGYRWWKVIGPRMSMADDGLTFGTNTTAGVCVHFRRPVPSVLRRQGHSALTVTVGDLDGLVVALGP